LSPDPQAVHLSASFARSFEASVQPRTSNSKIVMRTTGS